MGSLESLPWVCGMARGGQISFVNTKRIANGFLVETQMVFTGKKDSPFQFATATAEEAKSITDQLWAADAEEYDRSRDPREGWCP